MMPNKGEHRKKFLWTNLVVLSLIQYGEVRSSQEEIIKKHGDR